MRGFAKNNFKCSKPRSRQTQHVYPTLKRHGNDRFRIVSTWNARGVFVGCQGCF